MFNFFKCQHPFARLVVLKDSTVKNIDADFDQITYHFFCTKCGEHVNIDYAKMIGGVDAFLKR